MLRLDLTPSWTLTGVFFVAYAFAGASLLIIDLSGWGKLFLGVALVASLSWTLFHFCFRRSSSSVVHLQVEPNGSLLVQTRSGQQHKGHIHHSSFVTPWLTIIVYGREDRRFAQSVLITPDSVLPEPFRQLRVCLKWAVGQGSPDDPNRGWAGRL